MPGMRDIAWEAVVGLDTIDFALIDSIILQSIQCIIVSTISVGILWYDLRLKAPLYGRNDCPVLTISYNREFQNFGKLG